MPRLTRHASQEQTRQRLLDAAVELFLEKGFAGASVEEIAERAGYSKGAVYSNFASKEDLALAVLDRRYNQQLEVLTTLIPVQGGDPNFWINQGQAGSQGPWEPLFIELWVQALYNDELRHRLAQQRERVLDAASRILSGGAPPTEKQRDAVIINFALGSGLAIQYAIDSDDRLMQLYADLSVRLFNELRSTL